MMKTVARLLPRLLLLGCGGDDSSGPPKVAGQWSGQMHQASGGVCSDGGGFNVGIGVPTRVASLAIEGGDAIGDVVKVSLDGCVYGALRKSTDFIPLEPSGDVADNPPGTRCARDLELTEIRDGAAHLLIDPGPPPPPEENPPGTVICHVLEDGDIFRE